MSCGQGRQHHHFENFLPADEQVCEITVIQYLGPVLPTTGDTIINAVDYGRFQFYDLAFVDLLIGHRRRSRSMSRFEFAFDHPFAIKNEDARERVPSSELSTNKAAMPGGFHQLFPEA